MKKIIVAGLLSVVALLALNGCMSMSFGSNIPNVNFVYPNSNVTALGQVHAEKSKFMIFFVPTFKKADYEKLMADAMAQKGGNTIINAKMVTTTTSVAIFYTLKVTLDGTAAKMEVGKQKLY